jgi:hypothetical protein
MAREYDETLRFPTNLDRVGIERRLVEVRDAALSAQLPDVAALFENLSALSSGHLGTNVVAALTLVQEKPEHRAIAMQLEMVAMNLKNLK